MQLAVVVGGCQAELSWMRDAATSVQRLMCYILISLLCAEEGGVIHDDVRVSVADW
jgi:hypothetical protein